MPVKKNNNWKNFFLLLLGMFTYVIILSLVIAIPIRVASHYHLRIFTGFRAFLVIFGTTAALLINTKLWGHEKPRPLFTNFRDGAVISLSWLIFMLLAFLPFDLSLSDYLCAASFPLALFVAVSFSYLFGTEELKLKIRNYPKMFRRKRTLKSKSGGSDVESTDK